MSNWEVIRTCSFTMESSNFWSDELIHGVLSIEQDFSADTQRARFTDGFRSWPVDLAWAVQQMEGN